MTAARERGARLVRSREPVPLETRLLAAALVVAGCVGLAALTLTLTRVHTTAPASVRSAGAARVRPAAHRKLARPVPALYRQYPTTPALKSAFAYVAARSGVASFAVLDSSGRLIGYNYHQTFTSASIVKAMLLVAYLHELGVKHQTLDSGGQAMLYPMIHDSDNNAASRVESIVGDSTLRSVAHLAGMTDFSFGHDWANEQVSAADEVHLFANMGALIPGRYLHYARSLLSGIATSDSWGIPAVARPAWSVYFKGGWRRTGLGHLVNQAARLEQKGVAFELAVMTDGDPSEAYGIQTVQGATARVLAPGQKVSSPPKPAAQLPGPL